MVQILGLLDIIAAGVLVAQCFNWGLPSQIIIIFAVYLLLKAGIFLMDIASMLDIIIGILLLLSLGVQISCPVLYFFAFLLGVKGIESLFAS